MTRFYNDEELSKIKELEKGILKDFIELCEENNLRYFGMGGTCLGAVRHGGYIPWDDDIDVGMPRKDYNRFLKIAAEKYSDKYYLLNADEFSTYPLMSTRWRIKNTKFVEYAFMNLKNCPLGIFLDIFPYDNLADNRIARFFQQWRAWYLSKLMILRAIPEPYLAQQGLLKKIILFVCRNVHRVMKFFGVDRKKLYKKCIKTCIKYNDRPTKKIGYICDTTPHMEENYVKDIFPCRKMKFEEFEMNFPNHTHELLVSGYGEDYMTLPPVNKRKTHFPYILDFGDGKGERRS